MSTIHNFVVFNKVTGMIVSSGTTQLPELLETDINGVLVDTIADIENDYIDGISVKSKGLKPSVNHKFNYTTKFWEDPRTIVDLRLTKWNEIKLARDNDITTPITTPFGIFDTDKESINKLSQLLLFVDSKAVSINYTLRDNSRVTLNKAQLNQVYFQISEREQVLRDRADILRDTINTATTSEELSIITW